MLAHHRHRDHLEGFLPVIGAREPAVDADPGHVAAAADLVLADDGDVVLGAAGDEAGIAADAGIQIDRETPLEIAGERGIRVDGNGLGEFAIHLGGEVRLLPELLERPLAGDVAPLHVLVLLRAGKDVCILGQGLHGDTGTVSERGGIAERVGVESDLLHHVGDAVAAVAEGDADRAVGMAGSDQGGGIDVSVAGGDPEPVAILDAESLGIGGADEGGVVPDKLGDEIGCLLEPGIVGVAAVVDTRTAEEDHLELPGGTPLGRLDGGEGRTLVESRCREGPRGSRGEAVLQEGLPGGVGGILGVGGEGRTDGGGAVDLLARQ